VSVDCGGLLHHKYFYDAAVRGGVEHTLDEAFVEAALSPEPVLVVRRRPQRVELLTQPTNRVAAVSVPRERRPANYSPDAVGRKRTPGTLAEFNP
jgi:hypothetical protein